MAVEAVRWQGRHGWILLGPTEDRVARYLAAATRHGLVTLRTARIQDDLRLGRSETYRILRQLRILGLFGIESDQGRTHGGRRIWRIGPGGSVPAGAVTLDDGRHRAAWGRIQAWLTARKARILAALRNQKARVTGGSTPRSSGQLEPQADPGQSALVTTPALGPPLSMRDAMLRWAPALAREWRL